MVLRRLALAALALLLLASCGPTPAPRSGGDTLQGPQDQAVTSSAPKRLTLGILDEPKGFAPWAGNTTAGGAQQPRVLLARTLTVIDDQNQPRPELAAQIPSLERGDWRLLPEGGMEQTWTLKPNLRWHDGEPLTADDFVFGWEIEASSLLPSGNTLARQHVTAASAPDPLTLVLRFKNATPIADAALFDPYPRHLLGDVLARDPEQVPNQEYWTSGFVGAGPYSLTTWQHGSSLDLAAFADYNGGKPKIDRIVFRFLGDPNTMVANLLAGEIDVALPQGLSLDSAAELQRGWAAPGTGNSVILYSDGRLYRTEFQFRAEYARPVAARDPRVRRAFYLSMDKDAINDVALNGLGVVADSWVATNDPRRPQFADAIPAWSHDIALAQRILEDAGWRRGPDGILVYTATGERMETELRATGSKSQANMLSVQANDWRKAGAAVTETVIPAALLDNAEYRSTFTFASHTGHRIDPQWEYTHFACARISRPETRWTGNRNGFCDEASEPLILKLQTVIPESERLPLQVEIMRLVLKEDYGQLPLYWQTEPVALAKGITGIGPLRAAGNRGFEPPWNVHLWDRAG